MISETMSGLGIRRSAIRELHEYGKTYAAEHGEDSVCDFSLGNPSVPTPETFTKALQEILTEIPPDKLHGYTSSQGRPRTRAAVARHLNAFCGGRISPDRIYMTCGAAASLTITLRALITSPEDEVLVLAPFFPEYRVFIEGTGAKCVVVPPKEPDFGPNLTALRDLLSPRTRAVIVNSPNNPTGRIYSEEELADLAEMLLKQKEINGEPIYLIADEPYRELTYDAPVPCIPAVYPDTVICYSYSKSLSLPGERIGYIAIPDACTDGEKLYYAVCGAGRVLGYVCAPALMQYAVERCAGLSCDMSVYRENRDLLCAALTEYGYAFAKPDGAFYLFVRSPDGNSAAFCEKAKKRGLLLVPADSFGAPGYFRISYCVSRDTVLRSLPLFRELMS